MRHRWIAVLAVLLVSASAYGFWYSAMAETDTVKKATETKTFKHSVSDQAAGTHMTVRLRLDEGEVRVTLVDSAGAKRFDQTFRGKTTFDRDFDGKQGAWKLQAAFKGATGRYTFKLVDY